MKENETYQMLSCILKILKLMIESGAEIYRAEESAIRIFEAYSVKTTDVYATTSNIILSLEMEDGSIKTHTRRIGKISTNIEKIHNINALVRKICNEKPSLEVICEEIEKIDKTPTYSNIITIAFFGIIAGAFYMFFGGRNLTEFLVSIIIGTLTGIFDKILNDKKANKFLIKFISSFSACIISFSLSKLHIISNIDYIIIANIMTLIPGIGLTNSLRDLFTGDSISGVLRLIESALLALAIACGYIVTTFLFGGTV